jgi:hypothetical protein
MPNKKAKARKQERRAKCVELDKKGRTPAQIKRNAERAARRGTGVSANSLWRRR